MLNEFIFLLHIISVTILGPDRLTLRQVCPYCNNRTTMHSCQSFCHKADLLFGFNVTGTDVFIIGAELSLNLLQEFYGFDAAKKAIKISFLMLFSFFVYSIFQLWYTPSPADTMHPSFYSILGFTPRIIFASIIAYLISQTSSVYNFRIFAKTV